MSFPVSYLSIMPIGSLVILSETGVAYAQGIHTALVLCRNRSLVSVVFVIKDTRGVFIVYVNLVSCPSGGVVEQG